MASQQTLNQLFGGGPQTKAESTATHQKVVLTYKDGSTRIFDGMSKDEVSILSVFSLIDDTIDKLTIEVTFDRPAS